MERSVSDRTFSCPRQFDYYNIPFCEPKGGEKALAENLGEVLAGERTETSAYKCHTNVTRLCKVPPRSPTSSRAKTACPPPPGPSPPHAATRHRAPQRLPAASARAPP